MRKEMEMDILIHYCNFFLYGLRVKLKISVLIYRLRAMIKSEERPHMYTNH